MQILFVSTLSLLKNESIWLVFYAALHNVSHIRQQPVVWRDVTGESYVETNDYPQTNRPQAGPHRIPA